MRASRPSAWGTSLTVNSRDFDSEERMPRTERFELSEDPRSQNSSSGPITTCIEVSKDRSATPSEVFHDLPQ